MLQYYIKNEDEYPLGLGAYSRGMDKTTSLTFSRSSGLSNNNLSSSLSTLGITLNKSLRSNTNTIQWTIVAEKKEQKQIESRFG